MKYRNAKEGRRYVFSPGKRRLVVLSGLAAGLGCSSRDLPTALPTTEIVTSQLTPGDTSSRYIIRLQHASGDVAERAKQILLPHRGKVSLVFRHVFEGFVAEGLTPAAAALLAKSPAVLYIEREGFSYPTDVQTLTLASQWGLDWMDQHAAPTDGQFGYVYNGAGVHMYIVDSGVRGGHVEFTGRIGNGACKVSFSWGCSPTIDQIGHGTAVASQAAGTVAGMAKGATIHPVRIDDGDNGAYEGDLIDGLEWVLQNRLTPAVVNLSYGDDGCGCPGSFAVRDALQTLVNYGVVVVKSAGNGNRDAYQYRPNRVSPAFIVAAAGWEPFNQILYRMGYSNFGSTVSIYGPGDATYAAGNGSNTEYITNFGGTSGAAPFVAGSVAIWLHAYPYLTPSDIDYWVKASSSPGLWRARCQVIQIFLCHAFDMMRRAR